MKKVKEILCPDFVTTGYYNIKVVRNYFIAFQDKMRVKIEEEERNRSRRQALEISEKFRAIVRSIFPNMSVDLKKSMDDLIELENNIRKRL